jgi:hypothetical protein
MENPDKCCTIHPYFKVHGGQLGAFKALCERFVEKTGQEPKCVYCREGYEDAEGVLAHLENVGPLLEEALQIAELTRLEVHGPDAELAKLREPLAAFGPQFFTLEFGFRR